MNTKTTKFSKSGISLKVAKIITLESQNVVESKSELQSISPVQKILYQGQKSKFSK